MKRSNRPKYVEPLGSSHPDRVCLFGANGQLASKLTPWCVAGAAKGVTFYAADIVPQSKFSPAFTEFADYFNLTSRPDREKLFDRGRKEPFDLLYDATWPTAHLLNIVNQEAFFRHILVTKPFVAIEQISGLDALMNLAAFESVREKFLMADHFGSKPGLTTLLAKLAAAHELHGKYSRISILITERHSVNDLEEVRRQEALLGGTVPDLVSHGVLIVQLLTPKGLR